MSHTHKKLSQNGFKNMRRVLCSSVSFPVTEHKSNRTPFSCGRTKDSQHKSAPEKLAEMSTSCQHATSNEYVQHLVESMPR